MFLSLRRATSIAMVWIFMIGCAIRPTADDDHAGIARYIDDVDRATATTAEVLERPIDMSHLDDGTVSDVVRQVSHHIDVPIVFDPLSEGVRLTPTSDLSTVEDVLYEAVFADFEQSEIGHTNLWPVIQPYGEKLYIKYWRPYRGNLYEEMLHEDIRKRFGPVQYREWARESYGPVFDDRSGGADTTRGREP